MVGSRPSCLIKAASIPGVKKPVQETLTRWVIRWAKYWPPQSSRCGGHGQRHRFRRIALHAKGCCRAPVGKTGRWRIERLFRTVAAAGFEQHASPAADPAFRAEEGRHSTFLPRSP